MNIKTIFLVFLGFVMLAFGIIGIALPIIPTTPFFLAAFACFSTMPKLREKLYKVPVFNTYLENFKDKRGLPKGVFIFTLTFLWTALIFSAISVNKLWLTILLSIVGFAVTTHITFIAPPRNYKAEIIRKNKAIKVFGYVEITFNFLYLNTVLILGIYLLSNAQTAAVYLFAAMALVLVFGDSFHLVPRLAYILSGSKIFYCKMMGYGKMVTSVAMTLFYVLLYIAAKLLFMQKVSVFLDSTAYLLAAIRIYLCVIPQNKWNNLSENQKVEPINIYRNIPFILLGLLVCAVFFVFRNSVLGLDFVWLAILLSFIFYVPVVIWSKKIPPIAMLMLPKSCMYIWIITAALSLV